MSFLGDTFDFEKFNLKDMWKKIKDDPERLLVGAVDPWSTKLWNKVLDKDYEPIVDQMGGAYGGHTISAFGNQDGGVYKRAEDAGIDTKAGGQMHDLAHVISAMYAGGYGMGQLGGGGAGGAGGQGGWQQYARMTPQGGQQPPQNQNDAARQQLAKQILENQAQAQVQTPDPVREQEKQHSAPPNPYADLGGFNPYAPQETVQYPQFPYAMYGQMPLNVQPNNSFKYRG